MSMDNLILDMQAQATRRKEARANGEPALKRLFAVARSDTGQSRVCAHFLLGCYNGSRFPFDLTDLRGLDIELFEDCIAVLRMDKSPQQEVHHYFENGGQLFEQMVKDWGVETHHECNAYAQYANKEVDSND